MLTRAERSTTDPDLRARIIGTRAFVLSQTGKARAAEQMCVEALEDPRLSDHSRSILTGQLGLLATHRGDLDAAQKWLTTSMEALSQDPVAAAHVRVNRGVLALQQRRLPAAAADFAEAARVYADHDLPLYAARAQHNVGYAALLAGDLLVALQEMHAARPALAEDSPLSAAISDQDRAEVLREAGLAAEAEAAFRAAAHHFGAARMRGPRAEAEFQLARALLTHDPDEACQVAGLAAQRFRADGSTTWSRRAEALRLRARLRGAGARRPSREHVDRLAAELERLSHRDEADALRLTWRIAVPERGGDAPIRVSHNASVLTRLLAAEARVARAGARGDATAVRRHARRGVELLSHWQRSFGALDLQASVIGHGSALLIAGIGSGIDAGRPELLLEWSERARVMSGQVVPLRPPSDEALAEDLGRLRSLHAEGDGADPRVLADLRRRLRDRQWVGTGAASLLPRARVADVARRLHPTDIAVSYVSDGARLVALVVSDERARIVPLDAAAIRRSLPGLRADLDALATVSTPSLAGVVRAELADRLSSLSRSLVDPVLAAVGEPDRVVITVPGELLGVPWSMLPGLRERVVTVARSLSHWVSGPVPTRIGAVGAVAGPRTARGDEEVRTVAAAWDDARTLLDDAATVDAVTTLAAGVDVLHVTAHGRHAPDNPLFSGVELADGVLFGYDIDRIGAVPRTVILSACEVGTSSVRSGEAAVGMARAWLHCGAEAVIASPSIVADDAACDLLGAMHVELAAGAGPAEALARAARRTDVWAPFQCHGSGF